MFNGDRDRFFMAKNTCLIIQANVSLLFTASKKGSKDGGIGYSSNFGEPHDGGPTVQGQLMQYIAKPLVSKFVENKKDLQNHENVVCTFNI